MIVVGIVQDDGLETRYSTLIQERCLIKKIFACIVHGNSKLVDLLQF
jgi:hypothetical protein